MLISRNWRDYELIDCSDGERLERWGRYILRRPDPQVIWKTEKSLAAWESADGCYSSKSGKGIWVKNNLPDSWKIAYKELVFLIRPTNFKHTGLFPEQAVNWDYMAELIRSAGRKISVLNLFAYTGGATVVAASAGAEVCHVDAARGMVAWARENAAESGLGEAPVRWIIDDCKKFLEREIKRGKYYDAVIMDPPSYGRGPNGETWKLADDLWDFVSVAVKVLSDKPLFFLINSYTTGLSASVLTYIGEELIAKRYGGTVTGEDLGLPVTASGLTLPCGAAMRWSV